MKISLVLLAVAAIAMSPSAQAINTVAGFELPNPAANAGNYNGGSPINAQLSGLGADGVYGSRDAANNGFAAWEKWSSGSFSDFAPQYTGAAGTLNVTLDQSNTAAGRSTTGSNPGLITVGDTQYSGRLTTGGYDFSLDGTSSIAITSITLQIKHTPLLDEDFNPVIAFSATLNGVPSEPLVQGPNLGNFSDAISLNTTTNVYTYTWNNVNIAANEAFTVSFSSGPDVLGFGFSVDSVALSTSAVPEPGTWGAIMAAGLFALVWIRRKRLGSTTSA